MNPYAAHEEAPFHPHRLTRPASSRQTHGPPQRRLVRDPPQQQGGAACVPVLKHPPAPHGGLAAAPADPRRMSEAQICGQSLAGSHNPGAVPGAMQPLHSQTLRGGLHSRPSVSVSLQMAAALRPPHPQTAGVLSSGLPQAAFGPRKPPDSDVPPNVTVSTSTIPLSMAASSQQRGGDLSTIVHQINRLCQARAGAGATSVCEGQIANPSPISRNLLIDASSRVSAPPDAPPAPPPGAAIRSQPAVANAAAAFPADGVQVRRQCVWSQPRPPPEGLRPCKNLRLDGSVESAVPARASGYLRKPARADPPGPDCLNLPWGGSQVPAGFQAGRVLGAKYRLGQESLPGHSEMASDLDFLGGGRDFALAGFSDAHVDSMCGSAAGPPRNAACALHRAYR